MTTSRLQKLFSPQPDCLKHISADLVDQVTVQRWGIGIDGVAHIPYCLFPNESSDDRFPSIKPTAGSYDHAVRSLIRLGLDKWEEASDGLIQFEEQNAAAACSPHGDAHSIWFHLTNSANLKKKGLVQ